MCPGVPKVFRPKKIAASYHGTTQHDADPSDGIPRRAVRRCTTQPTNSQPRRSNNKATLFSVNVTVNELVFPTSGLSHAALPWIKLHLPFVYRIQLSPSLGPNYVWAFHRECFSSYGFLRHMDMEIEVHERFRRFVRPGDKYVRASYVQ